MKAKAHEECVGVQVRRNSSPTGARRVKRGRAIVGFEVAVLLAVLITAPGGGDDEELVSREQASDRTSWWPACVGYC